MADSQKDTMVARVWATLRKRDIIRQGMLDDHDNFQPWARVLMHDLGKFCYLGRPTTKVSKITGSVDPIACAVAEGRREVLLRILEMLRFSDDKALNMIEQLNQREE